MRRGSIWPVIIFVSSLILTGCLQFLGIDLGVPRMAKEELKPLLGNPDVIILDVRESEDWKEAKQKIVGAVREDPEKDIKSWAEKYPKDRTLVFY